MEDGNALGSRAECSLLSGGVTLPWRPFVRALLPMRSLKIPLCGHRTDNETGPCCLGDCPRLARRETWTQEYHRARKAPACPNQLVKLTGFPFPVLWRLRHKTRHVAASGSSSI
jgi:hypothetical protein